MTGNRVDLAEKSQAFGRRGLARASLAFGVLSALLGVGAVALGLTALRRAGPDRRSAIVGALLGATVVGWFIAYLVVDAIA